MVYIRVGYTSLLLTALLKHHYWWCCRHCINQTTFIELVLAFIHKLNSLCSCECLFNFQVTSFSATKEFTCIGISNYVNLLNSQPCFQGINVNENHAATSCSCCYCCIHKIKGFKRLLNIRISVINGG